MIGWLIAAAYLAAGLFVGRYAARVVYLHEREEFPSSARAGGAAYGIGAAVFAYIVTALGWPVVALILLLRRVAMSSIPEYRAARDKEIAAQLEETIRDQQREIARLSREIKGWKQ